jgi:hypothetical protein
VLPLQVYEPRGFSVEVFNFAEETSVGATIQLFQQAKVSINIGRIIIYQSSTFVYSYLFIYVVFVLLWSV